MSPPRNDPQHLSASGLKARGWTDAAIRQWLGEPDLWVTLSFDGGAPTPAALALLQRYLDLAIAALGPEAQLPTSHWPLDPGHEQRP